MFQKVKKYTEVLGPGIVTGAADDDPSGVATYSQTGAQYGNQFLWVSLFTFPLMSIVQEMCARIGIVTGRGLAGNIRIRFSRSALYVCVVLLFLANTFNIGADLAAMAQASALIYDGISYFLYVGLFTAVSLLLQIFVPYKQYAKFIKYLTFILLVYIAEAFFVDIDWANVAIHTTVPSLSFSKDQIILLCAILGTTISPYLFFWQTPQEVEEEIAVGKTRVLDRKAGDHKEQIGNMRLDVWTGMFFSNLVMFFIIAVCAVALHQEGISNIGTAADAAEALRPVAGDFAYFLFALGIVGTGLLAVPVLAGSSAYAVAETFRFREGLYRKWKAAKAFYFIIVFSMLVALGISYSGIDPIKTLVYSAVLNGIVAPVMLFFIVSISSNKKVMGHYVNTPLQKTLGWIIVAVMSVASLATMYYLFA
jgi:NRAMP (natural resistance-associated macrophage protein)-like metal ion transporter